MQDKKPIGFYLKTLDLLLTQKVDAIQAQFGLSRVDWQILNSAVQTTDETAIVMQMSAFADQEMIRPYLDSLKARGLLKDEGGLIRLSEHGIELFNKALEKQNEFRKKLMDVITPHEYQQTISTLKKMIGNIQ